MVTIQPAVQSQQLRSLLLACWNQACGPDLVISPAMVAYNTAPATGVSQAAWLARSAGQTVAIVLASVWPPATVGWIDAIAVQPAQQRQGIGTALLATAEQWLADHGCRHARLGGSLRPFAPGLPLELDQEAFFRQRGYNGERIETDVASDLTRYVTPAGVVAAPITSLQPEQIPELQAFFARAYPGRWQYEVDEYTRNGGAASDFLALRLAGQIEGFCWLTSADSLRPLDRFFMHRLPKPWGQLGPLGLSREGRGRGYGVALIDAALHHLRDQGVRGCVIDWTTLIELYGKFGFEPYRRYAVLLKELAS